MFRVAGGVLGVVLAVTSGVLFLATAFTIRAEGAASGTDLFATGFFLAVAIAGFGLVQFAWPGVLGRQLRRMGGFFFDRAMLYNPLVHALLCFVAGALLLTVAGKAAILVVLAITTLFAVGSPIVIALRPRWWMNAALSVVAWLLLFVLLLSTAEGLSHQRIGEDAMVLLFPFMVYPAALLASFMFYLVRRREQS